MWTVVQPARDRVPRVRDDFTMPHNSLRGLGSSALSSSSGKTITVVAMKARVPQAGRGYAQASKVLGLSCVANVSISPACANGCRRVSTTRRIPLDQPRAIINPRLKDQIVLTQLILGSSLPRARTFVRHVRLRTFQLAFLDRAESARRFSDASVGGWTAYAFRRLPHCCLRQVRAHEGF